MEPIQQYRVWWIPQIPMKAFTVDVDSPEQGKWLCGVLADYDKFQFDHNIKPDYCNDGGVQQYDGPINGPDDDGWYDLDEED